MSGTSHVGNSAVYEAEAGDQASPLLSKGTLQTRGTECCHRRAIHLVLWDLLLIRDANSSTRGLSPTPRSTKRRRMLDFMREKRTVTKPMIPVRALSPVLCSYSNEAWTEDERTIANKLAREEKVSGSSALENLHTQREEDGGPRWVLLTTYQRSKESDEESEETKQLKKDPTLPVSLTIISSFNTWCDRVVHWFSRLLVQAKSWPTGENARQRAF